MNLLLKIGPSRLVLLLHSPVTKKFHISWSQSCKDCPKDCSTHIYVCGFDWKIKPISCNTTSSSVYKNLFISKQITYNISNPGSFFNIFWKITRGISVLMQAQNTIESNEDKRSSFSQMVFWVGVLFFFLGRVEGYVNLVFWGNIWVWLHWWSVQSLVLKKRIRLSNELMGGRRRWCFGFYFSRAWKVKKMFWCRTCFIPLSVLFSVLCCFLIKWRDGEGWADWDDKEEGERWSSTVVGKYVTDDFSMQLWKELESAGES